MKTKDIKKMLKEESGDMTPDVLNKVKVSPINRLLKGEKALRVFKTTMFSLTLLLMAVIIVILSVSIYALMTQSEDVADQNYTLVSVWVYRGEADDSPTATPNDNIYTYIVNGDGQVVFAYDETSQMVMPSPAFLGNAVNDIPTTGATAIYVFTTSDRPAFARQFYNEIRSAIDNHDTFSVGVGVNYHVNDEMSRFMMGASVSALPGYNHEKFLEAEDVNDICALYVEFAK